MSSSSSPVLIKCNAYSTSNSLNITALSTCSGPMHFAPLHWAERILFRIW